MANQTTVVRDTSKRATAKRAAAINRVVRARAAALAAKAAEDKAVRDALESGVWPRELADAVGVKGRAWVYAAIRRAEGRETDTSAEG